MRCVAGTRHDDVAATGLDQSDAPASTPARLHEIAQITLAAPQAMVRPTDIIFAGIGPG
jgi:hypothetical protein